MSVDVITFGCRLNAYESEVIRRSAAAGPADTVVVNTCAVTAEAVRQAKQSIRRLKRERPEARIVVTGCAAQTQPALFAAMPEVDRVVGNEEKLDARLWRTSDKVAVSDIMAANAMRPHAIDSIEGRARAFVPRRFAKTASLTPLPFAKARLSFEAKPPSAVTWRGIRPYHWCCCSRRGRY